MKVSVTEMTDVVRGVGGNRFRQRLIVLCATFAIAACSGAGESVSAPSGSGSPASGLETESTPSSPTSTASPADDGSSAETPANPGPVAADPPASPPPQPSSPPATALPESIGASTGSLPAGQLPSIELTSQTGGTSVPFTVGQVFRQGDVPAGKSIAANTSDFQAVIRNRWPDGSAKAAVLSGRAALTANSPAALNLSVSDTVSTGPNISLAQLIALGPDATVSLAPFGVVSLASIISSPHRQTISGPEMSEWVYRQAVGSDQHLVVWWRLRYYGGADLDVMVGVENGYLTVPNPAQKNYQAVISINSSERLNKSIDHFHHTRWAAQFWYGFDPELVPSHDGQYLTDTKLFPNYGWRSPDERTLNNLSTSLEPFARNDFPPAIGMAGFHRSIGLLPSWDALYVTSTDARAWRSMIAHAYSYGRYGIHWRDESTQEPVRMSQHPNLVADSTTGITQSGTSNTRQYTPGSPQTGIPKWKASHHPAPPYAAALLTGEWWFIEQMGFVAGAGLLHVTDWLRGFGDGLALTYSVGVERSAAWRLRSIAMAAAATPDDWNIQSEFRQQWANNMKFYADLHVRGSIRDGRFVNSFGIFQGRIDGLDSIYNFNSGTWWGPAWMQAFVQASIGFAWDLEIGARPDHQLVRDFAYQLTTGLMGTSSGWDYRRGGVYDLPMATSNTDQTLYYPDFSAMLTYFESQKSLSSISNITDTVLRGLWTDAPGKADAFATSYWGNHQPARAYAVEHGAPGALAGYLRIINASNYDTMLVNLDNIPVWGIVPRSSPEAGG